VVLPCLNEVNSVGRCVEIALEAMAHAGLRGEVVVVDNGSTDGSAEAARLAGARVIEEPRPGYGSALRAGFEAARGDYVVMGDADLTYDFADVPRFVERLRAGADLVMGDRRKGMEPGAMPWLHKHIGNPLLSGLLNVLFRTGVKDAHCGLRAFRRARLRRLDLRSTGMELASEMVIRAAQEGLRIEQLPIAYAHRAGVSKLNTFNDGWRHLRFLLVHSPTYLFLVPGVALAALGAFCSLVVLLGVPVFGRTWELHALVAGSLAIVVGAQVIGLGLCAHSYGAHHLGAQPNWFERLSVRFRLERGLLAGGALVLAGLLVGGAVVFEWFAAELGELHKEGVFLAGATLVVVGAQVIFTSFMLSILALRPDRLRLEEREREAVEPEWLSEATSATRGP
jgi:glycosyltransferase involved in cell wall biosynthesis